MRVKSLSYVGTGLAHSVTGVGFKPKAAFVRRVNFTAAGAGVCATDTSVPNSKEMAAGVGTAMVADCITGMEDDGIAVGTDGRVNENGQTYYLVAMGVGGQDDFATGSFVGDAAAARAIGGLTFAPDCLFALPGNSEVAVLGDIIMNTSLARVIDFGVVNGDLDATKVTGRTSNGFSVATAMNTDTVTYHFIAFRKTSGLVGLLTWTGDAADDRNITGESFTPDVAFVKRHGASVGNLKTSDMASGVSAVWTEGGSDDDSVQLPISGGVQVGTSVRVNGNTFTYSALLLRDGQSSFEQSRKAVLTNTSTGQLAGQAITRNRVGPVAGFESNRGESTDQVQEGPGFVGNRGTKASRGLTTGRP